MEPLDLPERAVVLGVARSGTAASEALERRGVDVVAADRRLGNDEDLRLLDNVGLVVKSPGVAADHAMVIEARRRGIPVWGEVELGCRLLDNPLVGVTGTNGKTTTSELLGAIFAAAGTAVRVVGNVGRPLTGLDGDVDSGAWVVCELSSFQLEDVLTLRPTVAVLLNLEPDHLDRHGTLEGDRSAKLRIFENQTRTDTAVVPRGFGDIPGSARRVEFSVDDPLPAEPAIRGDHNRENAAAACAAARALGIEDAAIGNALRAFPGVPHRLELVGEVEGVRYVNDSKATNVAASLRALAVYADAPMHLIVGGRGKGESFDPLAAAIGPNIRSIYLIGESAREIGRALGSRGTVAGDLETAVALAARAATGGDVVLLSPACASFDQFENFERRGEEFRRLVQNLER
jgi:UDP-N-acetylmuramoylalanine--D-glutamate ligase